MRYESNWSVTPNLKTPWASSVPGQRRDENVRLMNKDKLTNFDELRQEYDLDQLRVRKLGAGRERFGEYVRLALDVAKVSPDADSVNEALRLLIRLTEEHEQAVHAAKS